MSEDIFQSEIRMTLSLSYSRRQYNAPPSEKRAMILASLISVSFTRTVVELDLRSTSSMVPSPMIAYTPSPAEQKTFRSSPNAPEDKSRTFGYPKQTLNLGAEGAV